MFKSISVKISSIKFNPYIASFCSMLFLLGFYFMVLSLLESKEYAIRQFITLWKWMIPLTVGFGVQVGLYNYMRNYMYKSVKHQAGLLVKNGSTSAGSMIICCLHHITDFLPIIGVSAITIYLIQFQDILMSISVVFNILGIIKMLNHIEVNKLYNSKSIFEKFKNINYKILRWGVVIISPPLLFIQYIIK